MSNHVLKQRKSSTLLMSFLVVACSVDSICNVSVTSLRCGCSVDDLQAYKSCNSGSRIVRIPKGLTLLIPQGGYS